MTDKEYLQKKHEIAQRYLKELEELDREFNLSLINLKEVPKPTRGEFMDSILPNVTGLTRRAEMALGGYIMLYIKKDFQDWKAERIPTKFFEENTISVAKLMKLRYAGICTARFIIDAFINAGLEVNFDRHTWPNPRQRSSMLELEKRQEERRKIGRT